jgi:menaquinone-9 beta-reductase
MDFDVIIAGAGPGGAVCALTLAGSGLSVAVLDKASFPRDKICGDAISGKAISLLKRMSPDLLDELIGFEEKIGSWGIRFVAPNKKHIDIPFKAVYDKSLESPPGYISKRIDFDNLLVRQMENASNISFMPGFNVQQLEITADYAEVSSEAGQKIRGRVVVGADGAQSVIAKKVGRFKVEPDHYCAGLRAYYRNVSAMHGDNFLELHFLKEFLPGYFWIFPLPNGMVNVGVGMLSSRVSKKKVNLKEEMRRIIREEPSIAPRFRNAELADDIRGFGLPLGSKKRRISGERYLLTGDAASLIDPFTGEGIAHAMISGNKAGEQILKCFRENNFSENFMSAYDEAVYKRLWNELKLSHMLQKLSSYPGLFNLVVNRANSSPTLRNTLISMFDNIDLRSQLRNPAFYARLLIGR